MKWIALAAAATLAVTGTHARADDAARTSPSCSATSAWPSRPADQDRGLGGRSQKLPPITNPQALAVFAGKPNRDGKMLSFAGGGVPGPARRGRCRSRGSVRGGDAAGPGILRRLGAEGGPGDVEAAFAKMVAQAAGPGIDVKLAEDRTAECPEWRRAHSRLSRVVRLGAEQLRAGDGHGQPFGRPVPGDAGDAAPG